MLEFYFDHHVQSAIADGRRQRGVDVLTAFQDGYAENADEDLLLRSCDLGRLLVTYDFGFLQLARLRQRQGHDFPGLVFGFQRRVEIGTAVRYLHSLAKNIAPDAIRNTVVYIPSSFSE